MTEHLKYQVRNKILTSYGLIAFTFEPSDPAFPERKPEVRFLMTRRRDTFSYECILRGHYTPEVLREYVQNTTQEERERLMRYPFDALWKDLWVSTKRRLFRMEYRKANDLFDRNIDAIRQMICECPRVGTDVWEFPKGRMFSEESGFQCALREFEEETNIKRTCVSVIKSAGTHEDNYEGTDHNMYRSVYFIGYIHDGLNIPFQYQPCPYGMRADYISDEVMDIKWMSFEEAWTLCNATRKVIMQSVYEYIQANR
jgi:8-oxo-dGTP pyrophosphatase MutT (NUDIX family)